MDRTQGYALLTTGKKHFPGRFLLAEFSMLTYNGGTNLKSDPPFGSAREVTHRVRKLPSLSVAGASPLHFDFRSVVGGKATGGAE